MFDALIRMLRRYLGPDPTARWLVRESIRLRFDLESRALNGVALGDRFERLEEFGKPDNTRPVYYNVFKYISHGVVFETEGDRIDYIAFIFDDELDDEFRSPTVHFRAGGETLEIGKTTTKDGLMVALGAPNLLDTDEYEILLVYEIGDVKLEFELNLSETLKRLNVFRIGDVH
ncbi:MAG TPA: hypothetical protein PLU72_14570 [Candidatus Ozemobacteraceae bacterium]|nr:hypothetical protein [Candidatus Ozemobacteraceae bacterium]HQG27423.1 hypothetical protein [Candidatus Ozemobacteraceae bacterium]